MNHDRHITVRAMEIDDAPQLAEASAQIGWNKPISQFEGGVTYRGRYVQEGENVAFDDDPVLWMTKSLERS